MKQKGFTLIEVLVALAIISIALTAMMKAFSQNINSLGYLEDKIIANQVATKVVNEIRLHLIEVDAEGLSGETTLLGKKWHWQASMHASINAHVNEINVSVSKPDTDHALVNLKTFGLISDLKEVTHA